MHMIRSGSVIATTVLIIAGCGGGGGGESSGGGGAPSNTLGLNGTWGGVAEDIGFDLATVSATIEDRSVVQFLVDDRNFGETALITRLDSDVFEYISNFDLYGGFLTDLSNSYAVFVNEDWDFGVLQRNASAPFGTATIADLDGTWRGSVIGFFADSYFRYTASGSCSAGDCLFTITSPLRDSDGNVLGDLTGQQTTLSAEHWDSLAFDVSWANSNGSGLGSLFMSKDRNFVGAYLCPRGGWLEDCEFAAMVRQ